MKIQAHELQPGDVLEYDGRFHSVSHVVPGLAGLGRSRRTMKVGRWHSAIVSSRFFARRRERTVTLLASDEDRERCEALFGVGIQRTTKMTCGRLPTWHTGFEPRNRTKAS